MSSCFFYLKAEFPPGQAEKVEVQFRALLDDLADLQRLTFPKVAQIQISPCEERLAELKRRHQTAFEVVDERRILEYCRAELTPGLRRFGIPSDVRMSCFARGAPDMHPEFQLECHGDMLFLSAEVGRRADWEPFLQWLYARGAKRAGWISEEEVCHLDAIDMRGPAGERVLTVLTVYQDGGGDLQFHAGCEGDLERDVGEAQLEVVRQFWIDGSIVKESDHPVPYRLGGAPAGSVLCKICKALVPAATAHLHQGEWVGDACCWDERLGEGRGSG